MSVQLIQERRWTFRVVGGVRIPIPVPPKPAQPVKSKPEPRDVLCIASEGDYSTTRAIIASVAARHGLTRGDLLGVSRRSDIASARHEAMYIIKQQKPHLTAAQIARLLGRKDHTTALHAFKKFALASPRISESESAERQE